MDAATLEDVLEEIHNFFISDVVHVKACSIEGGELPTDVAAHVKGGAWYAIEGSSQNDGLHLHPATDLTDETFDGTVTTLAVPRTLLRLCEDIFAWKADYLAGRGKALASPYNSESFGGYTYNRKDFTSGGSGWRQAFAQDLNRWRKI